MFDIFDNRENKFISNKSYFVYIKNYYFIFFSTKSKKESFRKIFIQYKFTIENKYETRASSLSLRLYKKWRLEKNERERTSQEI